MGHVGGGDSSPRFNKSDRFHLNGKVSRIKPLIRVISQLHFTGN